MGLEDGLGVPVTLERPSQAEHGDYATNAALRAAPVKRKPPMEIAEELRAAAVVVDGVAEAQVAAPGFVNLWMSPTWYAEALGESIRRIGVRRRLGRDAAARSGGARLGENPTGPVTVASAGTVHAAGPVARLHAFAGHEVSREHYVNPTPAARSMSSASVAAKARGEDAQDVGYIERRSRTPIPCA